MAGEIGLNAIQFNQIDAYVQQINTELGLFLGIHPSTITGQIAYVNGEIRVDEKQQAATMIGGAFGREIIYPVPFFGNFEKARNPYEEVPKNKPELVNHKVIIREWAPDGELVPRQTQIADLYGLFKRNLPRILALGQQAIETHTADLLGFGESATVSTVHGVGGGNTQYDNLPFFHTAHLSNPNRPGVGVFSNLFNGLRLDRNGLTTMFNHLESTRLPDGQIVTLPGKNVIVVSTEDQYDRASVYLNGTIRATAIGGVAAASESNGSLRGRAELYKLPALQRYNVGAADNVAKGWYGFRVSGQDCGITVAVAEAIHAYIEGLDVNAHSRVTRNVITYGRRGHWGHGYLWPQLAGKAIER